MNIGLSYIHKTENLTEAAIEESMDPERKNATTHRFTKSQIFTKFKYSDSQRVKYSQNSNIQIYKESNIHRTQISRFTDLQPLSLCIHGLSKCLTTWHLLFNSIIIWKTMVFFIQNHSL